MVFVDDLRRAGFVMPEVTTYNFAGHPVRVPAARAVRHRAGRRAARPVQPGRRPPRCRPALRWRRWVLRPARPPPPAGRGGGAVLMYALMPHAYDAIVAGGGVTRGSGSCSRCWRCGWRRRLPHGPAGHRDRRPARPGALSHPQTAIYGAAASTVLVFRPEGLATTARRVVTMGVAAFLVVLPWLLVMTTTHGLGRSWRRAPVGSGPRPGPAESHLLRVRLHRPVPGGGHPGPGRRAPATPMATAAPAGCLILAGEADFIGAVPWSLLGGAPIAFVLEGIGTAGHRAIEALGWRSRWSPCSRRWSAAWVRWSTRRRACSG